MTKDEIILAQQARIEQLTNFIKYAQVSSGVCCCGDSMEGHPSPMTCGHSPVDMWDYHSGELLEAFTEVRNSLQFANDSPNGGINDTLWMMHRTSTIFDFMDSVLVAASLPRHWRK